MTRAKWDSLTVEQRARRLRASEATMKMERWAALIKDMSESTFDQLTNAQQLMVGSVL